MKQPLPLYWDEAGGRLLTEIQAFDREFLYQVSLAASIGSNPVGLVPSRSRTSHIFRCVFM